MADLAATAGRIGATAEAPVPGLYPLIPEDGPGRWLGLRGGPWVYPDRWQAASLARELGILARGASRVTEDELARVAAAADAGRKAARDLREAMAGFGVPLAGYLAVVVQDIDSMGWFLTGEAPDAAGRKIIADPSEHRRLSRELLRVAADQRAVLRSADLLSVPVYAGGDDLLAFTPAATALRAAQGCHDALPPDKLPTASTAVLFFHHYASIQQAMRAARGLLEQAKEQFAPCKHALAVGYLRRSGVREVSIQPWRSGDGRSSAELFGVFAKSGTLSPRLAADLERDAGELIRLREVSDDFYSAELARLIRRHVDGNPGREAVAEIAGALDWLSRRDGPDKAGRVGVFLRQEAR